MRFAPKTSVATHLTFAIFLAILVSWIISTGTSSYIAYQQIRALRQEMLARPDIYPYPIPEPRFGLSDFLFGPQPFQQRFDVPPPGRPPRERPGSPPAFIEPPPRPDTLSRPREPNASFLFSMMGARVATALLLALLAGKLLSVQFTRQLQELVKGASEISAGNLSHRITEQGEDEFSQVASAMNDMAERISQHVNQLEEEAERRRHFLADVAHELRSPVATIRTMSGALQDGTASDPQRHQRAVDSLVNVSERLLNLVTDLMQLAKLDVNELPIKPRPTDLRQLVSASIHSRADAAAQAGVMLHSLEPGQKVIAEVDPDRITQVIDNLLDNAIAYAGEGANIYVTVECKDTAVITVSDDGRGIPSEHLPYVYEPFYRADATRTPSEGHSGLGLRISKKLVEAHGGELRIESQEGDRTSVTIRLPAGC